MTSMRSKWLPENLLEGDVAFITGAGSGINQGIARMYAAHGAKVVIVGRTQEKLDQTCEMIRNEGGEALGLSADVRDMARMEQVAREGADAFGPYSIVVAGAAGNFMAPAAGISANGFSAVVDIDLKGSWHTFKACFPLMAEQNVRGLAITAPQSQMPTPFQSHVCSAKAAVDMLVKNLALEWGARNVRMNALSPGFVAGTVGAQLVGSGQEEKMKSRFPIPRLTTVEEMAQMALTLVSPLTQYMTGQVVALDGGISLLGGGAMLEGQS